MSRGRRAARLAGRIRQELMRALMRGELRDPRLEGLFVSDVRVSADLSVAWVYVRRMAADLAEEERARALGALERASGWLRRELASVLRVRRVPELRFDWDEVPDEAARIERLLEDLEGGDGGHGGEA